MTKNVHIHNDVAWTARLWAAAILLLLAHTGTIPAQDAIFLGDDPSMIQLRHQQQWGDFGRNTAAAAVGQAGSPMRIGDKTYDKGLGHHANGEISVALEGQFREFHTTIGVQWQGGNRGSVIFRVEVDGKVAFESQPISDSHPAQEVQVAVEGAEQLRLVALDAGDGIGCDMANWAEARLVRQSGVPLFGTVSAELNGHAAVPSQGDFCGLSLIARESGPQVAVLQPLNSVSVAAREGEQVLMRIPLQQASTSLQISARVTAVGSGAEVELAAGNTTSRKSLVSGESVQLAVTVPAPSPETTVTLATWGRGEDEGYVRWSEMSLAAAEHAQRIPLKLPKTAESFPAPKLPVLRAGLEQLLIEWDWRMQDGIGTPRGAQEWSPALAQLIARGNSLIDDLLLITDLDPALVQRWREVEQECQEISSAAVEEDEQWESLWRRLHQLRREIVLANPLAPRGPLAFVKQVPSCFSHQLTQYYGMCARPGGGIFVLEQPGVSMQCRELTAELPPGSFQHLDISWEGDRLLFAYCQADSAPLDRTVHQERHFHLYEVAQDGSHLRQLTSGDVDDFSPRYLPDGRLLFLSTRRGGFHRCGAGPCPVYTLATADADGGRPQPISFHETHEWDPAVLQDGRIIYTRWDYVDRHAVYYQQLWSCRPDGSNVAAYYGNNTLNPVGVWEARPVPNSDRVMATAGAHHAMTAGSIILLDVSRGIDGLDPITRLTPDALFPESEAPVQHWHATAGLEGTIEVPAEAQRWPGHCYRTPYPFSEDYFLAAYSFVPLIGEPSANQPNMFGIYLVDRFGNKELLYRDINISSQWAMPLSPRQRPPILPSTPPDPGSQEGRFFVENVYESWPQLPSSESDRITHLRVIQVLPKTTPHANNPKVGLANASPGKQVLGTVPVEPDGSAYFTAPARVALAFQALDASGMAVQTMRSLTYLQPGEQTSCVGCHEHRATTPQSQASALALQRPPTEIAPGPDGSRPLSYPILVQGVLDKHCVRCHAGTEAAGGVVLTGEPSGAFSASYLALAPLVPFSEWKGTPGENLEPLTHPNDFGARGSALTKLLLSGHEGVSLTEEEMQRLITWMDSNALFYGTFDPQDQQKQLQGERIAGPALE